MNVKSDKNTATLWNPAQYLKFAGSRLRPALDLLNQIDLTSPQWIYDLGCGAGNVTRIIADCWPEAQVVGVDHSSEMLEKAAKEESRISWQKNDVAHWKAPDPVDLIYSNATLHWLQDHETLFPRLLEQLAPGGVLAVQMPQSWHIPSHQLMREVLNGNAENQPLGDQKLRDEMSRPLVLDSREYYKLLAPKTEELSIWSTEYLQVLEGQDAVLEWVKGTGLRPILNGLSNGELEQFLSEYRQRLSQAYPPGKDGKTLYPFPRLFIVARV